jgi:hypothetical protein
MLWAEHSRELRWRLNAVLQRYNKRFRRDHRVHGSRCVRYLPSLYPNDDDIDTTDVCRVISDLGRLNDQLTMARIHPQSVFTDRPHMLPAGDEHNLLARLCQSGTKITSCTT